MRVLITGAAGRTGIAVMKALRKKKNDVIIRAFVHRPEQSEIAAAAGADEIASGDMEELSGLKKALAGVDRVYHICPAFHPEEDRIGIDFSELCSDMGTERFVYHSVLHSIAPDLFSVFMIRIAPKIMTRTSNALRKPVSVYAIAWETLIFHSATPKIRARIHASGNALFAGQLNATINTTVTMIGIKAITAYIRYSFLLLKIYKVIINIV